MLRSTTRPDFYGSSRSATIEPVGARAAAPLRDAGPVEGFAATDSGNAEAFAAWYGGEWRYDFLRGVWRHWDSPIWTADDSGLVYRHAKQTMRRRYRDAEEIADVTRRQQAAKWAIGSESRSRLSACLALAQNEERIADPGTDWDHDSFLLACPNGVVVSSTADRGDGPSY